MQTVGCNHAQPAEWHCSRTLLLYFPFFSSVKHLGNHIRVKVQFHLLEAPPTCPEASPSIQSPKGLSVLPEGGLPNPQLTPSFNATSYGSSTGHTNSGLQRPNLLLSKLGQGMPY